MSSRSPLSGLASPSISDQANVILSLHLCHCGHGTPCPGARGAFALFLLVEEAAVILDAADGRHGGGRNFNQVEAALACKLESIKGRENS